MLSAHARGRLTVVLVGARNPQNIGAAARAMRDFGFTDLRVVNDFTPPFEAAQLEATSAVRAEDVMRAARLYSNFPEAIADCHVIAGTTAIGGRGLRLPVLPLQEVAPALLNALETLPPPATDLAQPSGASRVALLFGSEKTGLTNEQLSYCTHLLTIPMFAPEGRHLSMNLGQSVAVCLYELTRSGFEGAREMPATPGVPASTGERERLLELLTELLTRNDYARRFPANTRVEVLRQLVAQLGQTKDEAATWMGILKMTLRRLPE